MFVIPLKMTEQFGTFWTQWSAIAQWICSALWVMVMIFEHSITQTTEQNISTNIKSQKASVVRHCLKPIWSALNPNKHLYYVFMQQFLMSLMVIMMNKYCMSRQM